MGSKSDGWLNHVEGRQVKKLTRIVRVLPIGICLMDDWSLTGGSIGEAGQWMNNGVRQVSRSTDFDRSYNTNCYLIQSKDKWSVKVVMDCNY